MIYDFIIKRIRFFLLSYPSLKLFQLKSKTNCLKPLDTEFLEKFFILFSAEKLRSTDVEVGGNESTKQSKLCNSATSFSKECSKIKLYISKKLELLPDPNRKGATDFQGLVY